MCPHILNVVWCNVNLCLWNCFWVNFFFLNVLSFCNYLFQLAFILMVFCKYTWQTFCLKAGVFKGHDGAWLWSWRWELLWQKVVWLMYFCFCKWLAKCVKKILEVFVECLKEKKTYNLFEVLKVLDSRNKLRGWL